jgi:hypothetical protein
MSGDGKEQQENTPVVFPCVKEGVPRVWLAGPHILTPSFAETPISVRFIRIRFHNARQIQARGSPSSLKPAGAGAGAAMYGTKAQIANAGSSSCLFSATAAICVIGACLRARFPSMPHFCRGNGAPS